MSDRVIRLGGKSIGNTQSINNLKGCLVSAISRNFIVFSAIPEIFELVHSVVLNVFSEQLKTEFVRKRLNEIFLEKAQIASNKHYEELVRQFFNIIEGIKLIGDYSDALKDHVLSFSEKFTAQIILSLWNKNGNRAKLLTPEDLDLLVTPDYGNATFLSLDKNSVDVLTQGIYLVPGSYGITSVGKIARTGKFAADYTAAFLTKYLGAEKLELWGLDFDFYRADPLIVPNPPKIKRLTYAEASELAYFDHFSFHPRTVEPLESGHIPIHVLNTSFSKSVVDTNINTETFVEEQVVKSVAWSDDISLLSLNGPGVGLKPGILAKITTRLNEMGINIKSVITSQISINLILGQLEGENALKLVKQLGLTSVRDIMLVKDISLVGVIGHGMQQNYGVSARIFNAVAQNKINVVLSGSGASDLVSYLIVKRSDKEKSVQEIYKAFF